MMQGVSKRTLRGQVLIVYVRRDVCDLCLESFVGSQIHKQATIGNHCCINAKLTLRVQVKWDTGYRC